MLNEFEARGLLHPVQTALRLEEVREPARTLNFPGKALVSGERIYIADTNHHQILEASASGRILRRIGGGQPGLVDGASDIAQFQQPQGMALGDGVLYVADAENHAIRAVDLATGSVRTLAGTGIQATAVGQGGAARSTPISSPWDIAWHAGILYIAMAGTHQIWSLEPAVDRVAPIAGTGREGLLDGPASEAWFAQSSGLALHENHLYIADAEVSAIRDLDLKSMTVRTLVGEDLFVFGDQDGDADVARLQHPLGVTVHEGMLLVADSYNNKIKRLDPRTRRVSTWLGSGVGGAADGAGTAATFREPGGVCAGTAGLVIADTNNHRIAVADWKTGTVRTLIGSPALQTASEVDA